MKQLLITYCAFIAILSGLYSCGETAKETTGTTTDSASAADTMPSPASSNVTSSVTILQNLSGSGNFSSLTAAVTAAGLNESWNAAGPYTVFAPTNDAFNEMSRATLTSLLDPQNKSDLSSLLNYHVVPGNLKAADLKNGDKLKTVNGTDLTVKVADGNTWINNAQVILADQVSSNGTFHAINKVLMP